MKPGTEADNSRAISYGVNNRGGVLLPLEVLTCETVLLAVRPDRLSGDDDLFLPPVA